MPSVVHSFNIIPAHHNVLYCTVCTSTMQAGATPLRLAAEFDGKECVKLLVHEYNADPEEVDIVSCMFTLLNPLLSHNYLTLTSTYTVLLLHVTVSYHYTVATQSSYACILLCLVS